MILIIIYTSHGFLSKFLNYIEFKSDLLLETLNARSFLKPVEYMGLIYVLL